MTGHPRCISCGMPMRSADEHSGGVATRTWCTRCSREDGTLKPYREVLEGMTGFLERTQGLDPVAARALAGKMLAGLPAWSGSR